MIRTAVLSLALLSSPALAASYYVAEPAAPPTQQRFVARDNVWRCDTAGCTSTRTASRPAIVCGSLVREIGAVRSFSVEGRAFGTEELQNCNSRAR